MTRIDAPSGVFAIVGRIQVNGAADAPAVHELQDAFSLRRLDGGAAADLPAPDPAVVPELAWWERFRVALAAFPPPAEDAQYLHGLAALGLTAPGSPLVDAPPALRDMLVAGAAEGQALLEQLATSTSNDVDGWTSAKHLFDYNLDHCGPGTIDAPEWKIADRARAYVTRAMAARAGLWGNHGYEADYELAWRDADGEFLDGANTYELRLADAAARRRLLVADDVRHPEVLPRRQPDRPLLDRRSDARPEVADDGSITITMSAESPGPDRGGQLAAGPGRHVPADPPDVPAPRREFLDGTYRLPPIVRVR